MNRKIILHLICVIASVTGLAVLLSGGVSFLMKDKLTDSVALSLTGLILFLFALCGSLLTRTKNAAERQFGFREGFAIVAFGWLIVSIVGALPFIVVSDMYWYDALFETASGFSTTGSSVISSDLALRNGSKLPNGVESLPYGILFWRSMTHWLGGMGIVVLTIAILPLLNIGGQALFNAEATGVKSSDSKITPRIASSAKILWLIYLGLTAIQVVFLKLGGMTLFDSICHSFGTVATGGFSTKQDSIAYYNSAYIDGVITFFMFLAGCNFLLHVRLLSGKVSAYWKDEEFRIYFFIILIASLIITAYLVFTPSINDPIAKIPLCNHFWNSFRVAIFQCVSIMTSTGFATADYCAWPAAAGFILFLLMFPGGCGGSTAGGLKCVRGILLFKHSVTEVRRCIFPHLIPDVRLNGVRLENNAIQRTVGFAILFFCIFLVFTWLIALLCPVPQMDFATAVSASLTCLSNIGPGFGNIGPSFSYAWMTPPVKVLLALEMLIGRLELFTILVLFLPTFWKK